jgi:SAM-dependent methyltransferase
MACRLCASRETTLFRVEGLEYADCRDCGYLGLGRRHFPSRASEEARYRLHRNDPADPGYRAYLEAFVAKAIAPHVPPAGTVLDFGSGPLPALSLLLEERGYEALPYDPYFQPSSAWRRRSWDCIALHEVAEHLRSPARSLAYLAERLAPGGILAIRTLFAPESQDGFASWWYRRDSTHLGFWRPASIEALASALGLGIRLLEPPDLAILGRRNPRARARLE